MPDSIADATETRTRSCDRFDLAMDTSRISQAYPVPRKHASQLLDLEGLAASNLAAWTLEILQPVRLRAFPPDPPASAGLFLEEVEAEFIREVAKELETLDDSASRSPSALLCRQFTDDIGLALAKAPGVRWALFDDEDGVVTLVAHCRKSRRQVSFEFHAAGNITIVSIDEQMDRTERRCAIGHARTLGTAIEWLTYRS